MLTGTTRALNPILLLLAAVAIGSIVPSATAIGEVVFEDLKLVASDGDLGDTFGHSIAMTGGIFAVGAPNDDDNGIDSGAAYLIDAATGTELLKLSAEDGAAGDSFGYSIAMSGGIVAIGAPG